ncbi:MAG: N4-gp56 family major capsid protein [Hyphomonas sp.]|nr:N4-gp56 family major capsid protein [Hyphomonas sp.]
MSMTSYGINDPEAVKLWSRKLARESLAKAWVKKFTGKSDDSVIQIHQDMKKEAGDTLTHLLRMQLNGDGVLGDDTLEGNEEALTTFTDSFVINQLRHAVRSKGKMSEKRVPFKHRAEAMSGLRDWWAARYDRAFFIHMCGFTATDKVSERGEVYQSSDLRYTGGNAALAPDSSAHFRADTNGSTHTFTATAADADITTTDTMRLEYIDELKAVAETRAPIIRPINYEGEKLYVMIMDTLQAKQLRTNTDTGQWQDIQKAAMQGGNVKKNPIFTGALGMYNNVVLHSSNRVCRGVAADNTSISTVRRAVFLGAQAGAIGFGDDTSLEKMSWHEELFDYGNQLGVEAGAVFGLKKSRFNSKDFGSLVFSTYAA